MKKKLYTDCKIFTSDISNPYADSMLVSEGKIERIGHCADIECECEKISLHGRRVIPGLIDSHMHPTVLARYSRQISALPPNVYSISNLQREIRLRREKQGACKWIEGWGYDEGKLEEGRAPNRYDLDKACQDAPVSILRTCTHIRSVNSKALEIAGIDKNTPDPPGGVIGRDANGEPNGILYENACFLFTEKIPSPTYDEYTTYIADLSKLLSSQGITCVCDMGALTEGFYYPYYIDAIKKGWRQKTSMYLMWDYFKDKPDFDITDEQFDKNNQIFIAGLKLISDGSVSGKTAWMEKPYPGTDECGLSVCPDDEIESALEFCKAHSCVLAVHAMGTKAIRMILTKTASDNPWTKDLPYLRLEHVTEPNLIDIKKAAEKNVYISTQPIFLYSEIESYIKNLGMERIKHCYPYKTMLSNNVKLSLSTDAPATSWADPSNPFVCIKGAVTRKAYDGTDCGLDESIDIETALRLYTINGAEIAGFKDRGMLKEGYFADFVVLDEDILKIPADEIDKIKPVMTFIDGECVYCNEK